MRRDSEFYFHCVYFCSWLSSYGYILFFFPFPLKWACIVLVTQAPCLLILLHLALEFNITSILLCCHLPLCASPGLD